MEQVADGPGPIFIGGTGRSGTSIMARLLDSHPEVVHPAHENKLIVESGGLMDLVDQLSSRPDIYRQHAAVTEFSRRARQYRQIGFQNQQLTEEAQRLVANGAPLHQAFEDVARRNPGILFNIHPLGPGFGLPTYDRAVRNFLNALCAHVVAEGVMVSDAIAKPFVVPQTFDRPAILDACRRFLGELYSGRMREASASRWCDDAPSNWLYADFLFELYPTMKFIHMVRDPRAVVRSFASQVWAPSDPKAVVKMLARQFADHEAVRSRIPSDRALDVRLEDLTADPERELGRVAAFLGLSAEFDLSLVRKGAAQNGREAEDHPATAVAGELMPLVRRYGYGD